MVDAEDEHLDQLDDDHQQQRHRQRASDAGEELWKQRTQQHHAQGNQRGDAYRLMHQRGVVAAHHQVDDEPERHHDQVVTQKTYPWLVGTMEQPGAGEAASEIATEEQPGMDATNGLDRDVTNHPPVDPEAPAKREADDEVVGGGRERAIHRARTSGKDGIFHVERFLA